MHIKIVQTANEKIELSLRNLDNPFLHGSSVLTCQSVICTTHTASLFSKAK